MSPALLRVGTRVVIEDGEAYGIDLRGLTGDIVLVGNTLVLIALDAPPMQFLHKARVGWPANAIAVPKSDCSALPEQITLGPVEVLLGRLRG